MKKEEVRDTISKQTPKNPRKYFLSVLEYFKILRIKKLPGSIPWWAQDTRARPGGLCLPRKPPRLRFPIVLLDCQDKKSLDTLKRIDHRIIEKSSVLLSCYFLTDLRLSLLSTRRVRAMLLIILQTLRFMGMWSTIAGLRRKMKTNQSLLVSKTKAWRHYARG